MSEWIRTAQVGDKVVVVGNHGLPATREGQKLKVHAVYTIRAIQCCKRSNGLTMIGLLLRDVHNRTMLTPLGIMEIDYDYRCFRPVLPRNTDISVFTDLLKTAPAPVEEAA